MMVILQNTQFLTLFVQKEVALPANLDRIFWKNLAQHLQGKGDKSALKACLQTLSSTFTDEEVNAIYQNAVQNYYRSLSSLIKNDVLRYIVMHSTIRIQSINPLVSVEKTLQAINDASSYPNMTRDNYARLLEKVGIKLEPQLLEEVFCEEQRLYQTTLLTPEEEKKLEVFEVIYKLLRDSDSVVFDELRDMRNKSVGERYRVMQEKLAAYDSTSGRTLSNTRASIAAHLTDEYLKGNFQDFLSLGLNIARFVTGAALGLPATIEIKLKKRSTLSNLLEKEPLSSAEAESLAITLDAYKNMYKRLRKREFNGSWLQTNVLEKIGPHMTLNQQHYFIKRYAEKHPKSRLAEAVRIVDATQHLSPVDKKTLSLFKVFYDVLRELSGTSDRLKTNLLDELMGLTEWEQFEKIKARKTNPGSRSQAAFDLAECYQKGTITQGCLAEAIVYMMNHPGEVFAMLNPKTDESPNPPHRPAPMLGQTAKSASVMFTQSPLSANADPANQEEEISEDPAQIATVEGLLAPHKDILTDTQNDGKTMAEQVACFRAIHAAMASAVLHTTSKDFTKLLDKLLTPFDQYDAIKVHAMADKHSRTAKAWALTEKAFASENKLLLMNSGEGTLSHAIYKELGLNAETSFFGKARTAKVDSIMEKYYAENFDRLCTIG